MVQIYKQTRKFRELNHVAAFIQFQQPGLSQMSLFVADEEQ
jgi:hypothetical protein